MRENIIDLIPSAPALGRREFFATSIISGFALAAMPIQAQTTIKTDSNGLVVGEVKIPVSGGEIPAYRAMPDQKGKKFPVVLVVHEIFGVHEWIQDVCRRFAKLGYMAIAPALYARQADISTISDRREIQRTVFAKIPDADAMSDLDAAVEYAKRSGSGNTKKLSITGFCWGGRIVWLYSAYNSKVKAGAAWYGRLMAGPNSPVNPLQPQNPIHFANQMTVPVLGLYGGKDTGIPQDTVSKMRDQLKIGKSGSEIIVYPDAGHGFHADYRESYNKPASEEAWAKLQAWFKKNGAF